MRLKAFRTLTSDLHEDAHVLVKVLGRPMHLGMGFSIENHDSLILPYIITDLSDEYSFRANVERSRY